MLSRRTFLTAAAATAAALPLSAPGTAAAAPSGATAASLPIALANNSGTSAQVYAYISGADTSGWPGFVGADGRFHRLPSPSSVLTPAPDYAIPLGGSGSAPVRLTLGDYVIGGRVWFSTGRKIQFFVNPPGGNGGVPGLVQPGFTSSDPNWNTSWTFCEFTYNSANLYANISYVDMVALPVSMATTGAAGNQSVPALPSGALASIAAGLQAQHAADGAPWDRLVATDSSGTVLRVLAPSHAPTDFGSYWQPYLDRVWDYYRTHTLTVDGQGSIGAYSGTVSGDVLTFAGLNTNGVPFTKPSAADIFGCASGPLYNSGADARSAVAARLAAALNRSSLLVPGGASQPNGVTPAQYYTESVTNHYARLVHRYATIGYAFPYDDVGPTGAAPVDGHLQDAAPTSWSIILGPGSGGTNPPGGGGTSAYSTIQAEGYAAQNGAQTESCADTGGGLDVGYLAAGDWLKYTAVDFGASSPAQFVARIASGVGAGVSGAIRVRVDSATGPQIAEIDLGSTGGWQAWRTVPANITGTVTGVHDVYLTFAESTVDFVNVNWFTFTR
ncbi:beta-1,3-glucanase family protein [Streptomyces sp. TG1A-8]|uniref:beta-1,3-glucanase family protein n=1 Tax=Streptomyces sp. TG1A-8 TaxID=3051385 RepID=UPI00265C2F2A|nr:beta-1,3-glucanase family protein [Streptomyces sp. TG1A-8]MDO0929371.1 beta-1,3-glucanase family protein [Streptomyces sp. TG1A-8]